MQLTHSADAQNSNANTVAYFRASERVREREIELASETATTALHWRWRWRRCTCNGHTYFLINYCIVDLFLAFRCLRLKINFLALLNSHLSLPSLSLSRSRFPSHTVSSSRSHTACCCSPETSCVSLSSSSLSSLVKWLLKKRQ